MGSDSPAFRDRLAGKLRLELIRKPARRLSAVLDRAQLRLLEASEGTYQPVLKRGEFVGADPRNCAERWALVEPRLPRTPGSAIDLGCSYGYFCLKLAERGVVALGIDNLAPTIDMAWRQAQVNDRHRVAFMNETITLELVDQLPTVDTVIFFSLMHHLMYLNGPDWAAELLRRLRPKIRDAMFFDMGQSNEPEGWAPLLPDMGPRPAEWIQAFLQRNGYPDTTLIGEVKADRHAASSVTRALFHAR